MRMSLGKGFWNSERWKMSLCGKITPSIMVSKWKYWDYSKGIRRNRKTEEDDSLLWKPCQEVW